MRGQLRRLRLSCRAVSVIIRKQTDPAGDAASFSFTTDVAADPAHAGSYSLSDDGVETISNVIANTGGTAYTVTESVSAGWDLTGIDCSAISTSGVSITPIQASAQVSFTLAVGKTIDCTLNRTRFLGQF